ncbi:MAG: hypothetical protein LWY06_14510, partial [Firmicutes bacterium]|nr:hypothetical protein [Bacillota bacterium]
MGSVGKIHVNPKYLIVLFVIFIATLVMPGKFEKSAGSVQYVFDGLMEKRKLKMYEWGTDPQYFGNIYVSQPTLDILKANGLQQKDIIMFSSDRHSDYFDLRIFQPSFS